MKLPMVTGLLATILLLSLAPGFVAADTVSPIRIETRDGVELVGKLTIPDGGGPFPAVVVRTTYSYEAYSQFGEIVSELGIAMVAVDVRGRHESDGSWEPLANEAADGQDVLAWVSAQPWSNGKIATFGGSYDAWVQMLTASRGAPELDTMILIVLPGDPFENAPFENGAWHAPFLTWAVQNRGRFQEPLSLDRSIYDVFASYPVVDRDDRLGRPVGWLSTWLMNWELNQYWMDRSYEHLIGNVGVPVLLNTGWFDLNQPGSIRSFQKLRSHSESKVREGVKLVIGPWNHGLGYLATWGELEFPENARVDLGASWVDWIENQLIGSGLRQGPPVEYYLMGRNEWYSAEEWPPRSTREVSLYLSGHGGLVREAPETGAESYVYDPEDPTPIVDPLPDSVSQAFGHFPHDVTTLTRRSDVLYFETEVLRSPVAVAGPVTAEIFFSSSAPDTDVGVQLLDITPDGRAIAIQHGLASVRFRDGNSDPRELQPGEVASVEVDMWSTAYEFAAGHRMAVLVSSAQFPAFDAHRNLFDNLATGTQWQLATQTVHMGGENPSRLVVHQLREPRRRNSGGRVTTDP